jgi:hypothetical protein
MEQQPTNNQEVVLEYIGCFIVVVTMGTAVVRIEVEGVWYVLIVEGIIAESSYDIATTSTSAAPKSLYSTTTTSSIPIVVPQKRIPNTEASITSTRDMSKFLF